MKKVLIPVTLALAAVAIVPAFARQPKSTNYAVTPRLNCENCENRVKTGLLKVEGIDSVFTDLQTQTVRVVYDADLLQPEAIVSSFKEIGYEVTPACCAPKPAPKVTQPAIHSCGQTECTDANLNPATTTTEQAPLAVPAKK